MALNREFFEGLGESLSRTAKDLGEKASNVYETQKLRSRISTEERTIDKLKGDIGNLIFSRYENGDEYEGELGRLCREITEHQAKIRTLEKENAAIRGKKICPSCRREVPVEALFCPSCGTACPNPEPVEDEIPDVPEDIFEDETVAAPEPEISGGDPEVTEAFTEAVKEAAEAVQEAADEVQDAAGELASEAADAVEEDS